MGAMGKGIMGLIIGKGMMGLMGTMGKGTMGLMMGKGTMGLMGTMGKGTMGLMMGKGTMGLMGTMGKTGIIGFIGAIGTIGPIGGMMINFLHLVKALDGLKLHKPFFFLQTLYLKYILNWSVLILLLHTLASHL